MSSTYMNQSTKKCSCTIHDKEAKQKPKIHIANVQTATRLFVTIALYFKGLAKAKNLSTVNSKVW